VREDASAEPATAQEGHGREREEPPQDGAVLFSRLRVFVANGYYDLATPCTVKQLGSDCKLLDRVTMAYSEAGHMMYLNQPSLLKLKADAAEFSSDKK
jgi:carboxypeptidase C (cathepsin A)